MSSSLSPASHGRSRCVGRRGVAPTRPDSAPARNRARQAPPVATDRCATVLAAGPRRAPPLAAPVDAARHPAARSGAPRRARRLSRDGRAGSQASCAGSRLPVRATPGPSPSMYPICYIASRYIQHGTRRWTLSEARPGDGSPVEPARFTTSSSRSRKKPLQIVTSRRDPAARVRTTCDRAPYSV